MAVNKSERYYTFADYLTWDDDERWEIIDGIPYAMSPGPSWNHQAILGSLHRQLSNFLLGKPCKVLLSPLDVRLDAAGKDDTVVQPDLVVVCDKSKLDKHGLAGAPDMAVEILSPSTIKRDMVIKLRKYQQSEVLEYWIVDPLNKTVSAYDLIGGVYTVRTYDETEKAPVRILDGCIIDLGEVFEQ